MTPAECLVNEEHVTNLHFVFSVLELVEIKESAQTLVMEMYFTIQWEEPRLVIEANHSAWEDVHTGQVGEVREDVSLVESLWLPTLEVMGLKDVDTNKVTTEMGGLSINRNKTLSLDRK